MREAAASETLAALATSFRRGTGELAICACEPEWNAVHDRVAAGRTPNRQRVERSRSDRHQCVEHSRLPRSVDTVRNRE